MESLLSRVHQLKDTYVCGPQILYPFIVGALFAAALVSIDFAVFTRRFRQKKVEMNGTHADSTKKESVSLAALPSELRLIICAGGIYACYLTFGVLQEEIYKYRGPKGEKFTGTLFLLLVQCVMNAAFALVFILGGSRSKEKIPLLNFGITGSSYILAMFCSNQALKYVSYPTQALGKSCKMVPVMFFGVLIRGKRYKLFEYACVLMVTAGITLFQLGGKKKAGGQEDSAYGILLLGLSLAMDGVTGAVQDHLKTICKPTVHEFMFYTNAVGVAVCAVLALATGQLFDGWKFCVEHPEMWRSVALFSLTSALGQNFIFLTIKYFDALVLTTVTTTRKFFTILVSVLLFGHSLNQTQWLAVAMVSLGLVGEIYEKYEKKQHKKKISEVKKEEKVGAKAE